jgi:hypothetical protein
VVSTSYYGESGATSGCGEIGAISRYHTNVTSCCWVWLQSNFASSVYDKVVLVLAFAIIVLLLAIPTVMLQ